MIDKTPERMFNVLFRETEGATNPAGGPAQ
jgi:hypothetical protein